ncbi:hypothetical protein C8F01DRAFT_412275 [Mycena amicta]|nr:hypothetical protein C8F01DRAFT_412275 [Mycena amicta]
MSGSSPSLPVKTPSTKTNIAATVPDNGPTQSVMTSVSHSESAPRVADSSAQTASSLATLSSKAASVKATSSHSSAKSSKLATTGTKAPLSPVTSPTVSFTATSTITDTPESTLAKPSFVSVIESNANGQTTAFTAPPFLTFLSTSTETNGSLVTFTHIVANPTGFNQAIGHSASFFHNAGAVAGVFLVVGAIMTGLVVFALFLLCRRQRRRRELHRRWLVSMHRPRPLSDNDTFVNPEMRSFDRPWDGRISSPHGHYTVAPPRRVDPPMLLGGQNNNRGPQAGPYDDAIGLAITTDDHRDNPSVESSPSIYPASLTSDRRG